MNLTLDLQIIVGTHPRKARESCVREMASQKGAQQWLTPVRFTHNPSSMGLTKKKLRTCSIFTSNTSVAIHPSLLLLHCEAIGGGRFVHQSGRQRRTPV
jgi:hypothetical protein